jgi:hypothetical protein
MPAQRQEQVALYKREGDVLKDGKLYFFIIYFSDSFHGSLKEGLVVRRLLKEFVLYY